MGAVSDLSDAVTKIELALDRSQKASPALEEQVRAWLKVSEERHQQVIDPLRMKKHQKQAPGTISAEDFLRPNPNVRNDDGILQNLTERVSSVKVWRSSSIAPQSRIR